MTDISIAILNLEEQSFPNSGTDFQHRVHTPINLTLKISKNLFPRQSFSELLEDVTSNRSEAKKEDVGLKKQGMSHEEQNESLL